MNGGNHVWVLAGCAAVTILSTSRNSYNQNLAACAIGYDSRVTKSSLKDISFCRLLSCTHCHLYHIAPSLTVVVAGTAYNIHLAETGVCTTHKTSCGSN